MRFNPSHILFRYIVFTYLKCFGIVILGFFAITSMLEYLELVRKFAAGGGTSHKIILELMAFNSISTISSFFPFIAFVGTILFFSIMHAKLEITVIKVLGVSIWNIVKSLSLGGLIIGFAYLTIFDSVLIFSVNRIKTINSRINNGISSCNVTIINRGVWFRDIYADSSYIVHAKSFLANSDALLNVRFFQFNINSNFQKSIYSDIAFIKNRNWNLKDAKIIDLSGNEKRVNNLLIPTTLSLKEINKIIASPKSISVWNMSKYISIIDKVGLSSTKYKVHLFYQISSIFQTIALILLASVFCTNYNIRNPRRYNFKAAIALSISFPIYFLNNILIALGETGDIPIIVAVILTPVLITIICSWLLSKK
ncbi:MAG: LptF/LptG family permease [Holosporales bacterium]|jgi:lipopolysaccharide export system permease protein|nr:LptF/LptG family permease [Holosporales bacterium]